LNTKGSKKRIIKDCNKKERKISNKKYERKISNGTSCKTYFNLIREKKKGKRSSL